MSHFVATTSDQTSTQTVNAKAEPGFLSNETHTTETDTTKLFADIESAQALTFLPEANNKNDTTGFICST